MDVIEYCYAYAKYFTITIFINFTGDYNEAKHFV